MLSQHKDDDLMVWTFPCFDRGGFEIDLRVWRIGFSVIAEALWIEFLCIRFYYDWGPVQ